SLPGRRREHPGLLPPARRCPALEPDLRVARLRAVAARRARLGGGDDQGCAGATFRCPVPLVPGRAEAVRRGQPGPPVLSHLVLGGTSEIALACLRALDLRPGASVVLAGRSAERLEAAGAALTAAVSTAHWDADVADPVSAARAVLEGGEWDLVLVAAGVLGD